MYCTSIHHLFLHPRYARTVSMVSRYVCGFTSDPADLLVHIHRNSDINDVSVLQSLICCARRIPDVDCSKTSLIRTLLNQTSLNPDRVPGKIIFYFGADNSRINHWHESEVTAGF
jgi:hypothetical protein